MPEAFVQLPADSTGKKLRTRERTVNAQSVHDQAVFLSGEPAWWIWVTPAALAANKHHLAIFNAVGSAQYIKVRKLLPINAQLTAATGVALELQLKRITALSGGTAVVPRIMDSRDTALANVTVVTAPTSVTEGDLLFSYFTNNDEIGATNAFPSSYLQALLNAMLEGPEMKELVLAPGEGITLKQITNTTVGLLGVLAGITREV